MSKIESGDERSTEAEPEMLCWASVGVESVSPTIRTEHVEMALDDLDGGNLEVAVWPDGGLFLYLDVDPDGGPKYAGATMSLSPEVAETMADDLLDAARRSRERTE